MAVSPRNTLAAELRKILSSSDEPPAAGGAGAPKGSSTCAGRTFTVETKGSTAARPEFMEGRPPGRFVSKREGPIKAVHGEVFKDGKPPLPLADPIKMANLFQKLQLNSEKNPAVKEEDEYRGYFSVDPGSAKAARFARRHPPLPTQSYVDGGKTEGHDEKPTLLLDTSSEEEGEKPTFAANNKFSKVARPEFMEGKPQAGLALRKAKAPTACIPVVDLVKLEKPSEPTSFVDVSVENGVLVVKRTRGRLPGRRPTLVFSDGFLLDPRKKALD